jgi:hypothetical protein
MYRFMGFYIRLAGPSLGAGRNQEKQMKNMKRALRRHHVARLKATRLFHWGRDLRDDAKSLGKAVASVVAGCAATQA